MAHERVDIISVLVEDDDETSLAIVGNILNSLGYKDSTCFCVYLINVLYYFVSVGIICIRTTFS